MVTENDANIGNDTPETICNTVDSSTKVQVIWQLSTANCPSSRRDLMEDSPFIPFVDRDLLVREDQACALEILITERQARGTPCDQAELFQEALDLFINNRLLIIDRKKTYRQVLESQ
jgi:hypothetical protein